MIIDCSTKEVDQLVMVLTANLKTNGLGDTPLLTECAVWQDVKKGYPPTSQTPFVDTLARRSFRDQDVPFPRHGWCKPRRKGGR